MSFFATTHHDGKSFVVAIRHKSNILFRVRGQNELETLEKAASKFFSNVTISRPTQTTRTIHKAPKGLKVYEFSTLAKGFIDYTPENYAWVSNGEPISWDVVRTCIKYKISNFSQSAEKEIRLRSTYQ